jgi:hypothetical protein
MMGLVLFLVALLGVEIQTIRKSPHNLLLLCIFPFTYDHDASGWRLSAPLHAMKPLSGKKLIKPSANRWQSPVPRQRLPRRKLRRWSALSPGSGWSCRRSVNAILR